MALCIATAAGLSRLAIAAFTLAWTHSVEKSRWEEDWIVERGLLTIVEARVEGSGAGMEPGEGALFDGRYWRWRPQVAPLRELVLSHSRAVSQDWTLCALAGNAQECIRLGVGGDGDVFRLAPCPP